MKKDVLSDLTSARHLPNMMGAVLARTPCRTSCPSTLFPFGYMAIQSKGARLFCKGPCNTGPARENGDMAPETALGIPNLTKLSRTLAPTTKAEARWGPSGPTQ